MSYKLTLSRDERRAIDFVGGRYAHGDDLFMLIRDLAPINESDDEYVVWNSSGVRRR